MSFELLPGYKAILTFAIDKQVIFVTNNATKSRRTYKLKFDKHGIEAHLVGAGNIRRWKLSEPWLGRDLWIGICCGRVPLFGDKTSKEQEGLRDRYGWLRRGAARRRNNAHWRNSKNHQLS